MTLISQPDHRAVLHGRERVPSDPEFHFHFHFQFGTARGDGLRQHRVPGPQIQALEDNKKQARVHFHAKRA